MGNVAMLMLALFTTTIPEIAWASKEAGLVDLFSILIGVVFLLLWAVFAGLMYFLTRKMTSQRKRRILRGMVPVLMSVAVLIALFVVLIW